MIRCAQVALVAGFLIAAASSPARAQIAAGETPVIVAEGEASITAAPDRAWIQVAAEGRGPKSADAQRIAAGAMASVQAALKQFGIAADAIKTSSYTLQAEYDFVSGKQKFRDMLASNRIEVRLDDISKLGDVLDAVGASGAASISGLRFDVKGRAAIEHDALARAVKDALDRATALASGASRSLGAILRIQEQRSSPPMPMAMTMSADKAVGGFGTPIAPGEIEIRAQVTVTVAIR